MSYLINIISIAICLALLSLAVIPISTMERDTASENFKRKAGDEDVSGERKRMTCTVRVLSEISVYATHVEIAWDVPSEWKPLYYMIYLNGSEYCRAFTNQYTFVDLSPNVCYEIVVVPVDEMGFQYAQSKPVVIKPSYDKKRTLQSEISEG